MPSHADSLLGSAIHTGTWVLNGSLAKLDLSDGVERRIIAGYANVPDVVDKQGEMITRAGLDTAWSDWRKHPEYCMIQVGHTSTPIGKVLFEEVIDSAGKPHKSGMDEYGLYLVAQIRDDTVIANRVWNDVLKEKVRGFSIGGIRLQTPRRECKDGTCYNVLEHFELHETSVIPKPANEWSVFGLLKGELSEVSKVTNAFPDNVLMEDFVRISKTPCSCGKYHVLAKFNVEGLDIFNTDTTFVDTEAKDGKEYIPLFDLSLLRPFSLEKGVPAESNVGGFALPPKKDEPIIREGDNLKKEVNPETPIEGAIPLGQPTPEPVPQPVPEVPVVAAIPAETPAVPTVTLEDAMGKIAELEAKLQELTMAAAKPVPEIPAVPIEQPAAIPAVPVPDVPTPVIETRGKVPPKPAEKQGFNLLDLHRTTWEQLGDLAPDTRRN